MRPQHITAENTAAWTVTHLGDYRFNEAAAYHCGKPGVAVLVGAIRREASMRPQHITAENTVRNVLAHAIFCASMRPQHITAENDMDGNVKRLEIGGFNEAAAYHCGKHPLPTGRRRRRGCFNEAAAYHCGKH